MCNILLLLTFILVHITTCLSWLSEPLLQNCFFFKFWIPNAWWDETKLVIFAQWKEKHSTPIWTARPWSPSGICFILVHSFRRSQSQMRWNSPPCLDLATEFCPNFSVFCTPPKNKRTKGILTQGAWILGNVNPKESRESSSHWPSPLSWGTKREAGNQEILQIVVFWS